MVTHINNPPNESATIGLLVYMYTLPLAESMKHVANSNIIHPISSNNSK